MKWVVGGLALAFGLPLLLLAPMLGMLTDPFAPWRFSGQVGQVEAAPPEAGVPFDPAVIPVTAGGVTDAFRYQLARAAGWNLADAITAVAISIAENGAGNASARCFNCAGVPEDSRGLWQVNVMAHPQFANWNLYDPQTNAKAAHAVYLSGGWCGWSTYETSCGSHYSGAYRAYLRRAQAASQVQLPPGQA